MNTPNDTQLARLPLWARQYIDHLQQRVRRAEETIPWTQPGMEWFTLLKDSNPETLFLCDRNGTHAIASIGRGDIVFVGRADSSSNRVRELREMRDQIKGQAKVSQRMAGMDTKADEARFKELADAAAGSEEFDALFDDGNDDKDVVEETVEESEKSGLIPE